MAMGRRTSLKQCAMHGTYPATTMNTTLVPEWTKRDFMWITLNKPFGGQPYADPEVKQAHWRGWAVRVNPETGEMFPMAAGLRSPAGVENSPWGDIFLYG